MIAIPISGAAVRRTLRSTVVLAIAVITLAFSVPHLVASGLGTGEPAFYTAANVVVFEYPRARAAHIQLGDRIDYSLMPIGERYGNPGEGLRLPPLGKPVSYVVERDGRKRVVTFAAAPIHWGGWRMTGNVLPRFAGEAAFFVLMLLASALVLIRPTPLSWAFFLFVGGYGAVMPDGYALLPPWAYAALVVAADIIAGLGAIGFLALAFYLDPRRRIRLHVALAIGAVLLAVIVVPVATSDVRELIQGTRTASPVAGWASFSVVWLCFVAGCVLLLRLAASTGASRILRFLAVLLAIIGACTILGWTQVAVQKNAWYFANLPSAVLDHGITNAHDVAPWPIWAFMVHQMWNLRPPASLLAFYVIVSTGIADTGPVFRRLVAYVIVALLVAGAFVLASAIFAPAFADYADYPLIVPFEIIAAIVIGYWVSGLRDLTRCLSLAGVDAWNFWAKGHVREERDALAQSVGLAERTRRQGIIAEVRAHIAFSAWRDGDDGEFELNADSLRRLLAGRNIRGLRGFAHAATSDDDELRFEKGDLLEWRARAALLLCARTNDAGRAQQLASDALASADRAGSASLQVLASVAVAETRSDQRNSALERAHAIARDAGWPALSKSILALRADSRDIGILAPFVEIRLRKSRPARPMFEVSFFNAELYRNGALVPLTEKQLELLLTVASVQMGINDNEVVDALWPESDGDAARNSFRTCLRRLRESVSDARIVARVGKRYVLHPWADVDLWRFQSLISTYRERGGREGARELRQTCDALRTGQGRRATLGEWFYRFEQTLTRKLDEAERLLDREAAQGAWT